MEERQRSDCSLDTNLGFWDVRDGVPPGKDAQHAAIVLSCVVDDTKAGLESGSVFHPLEHSHNLKPNPKASPFRTVEEVLFHNDNAAAGLLQYCLEPMQASNQPR